MKEKEKKKKTLQRRTRMESQLNVAVKGKEREERKTATVRIQQGRYIVVRSMKPLSHGAISNFQFPTWRQPCLSKADHRSFEFFGHLLGAYREEEPGDPIDRVVSLFAGEGSLKPGLVLLAFVQG